MTKNTFDALKPGLDRVRVPLGKDGRFEHERVATHETAGTDGSDIDSGAVRPTYESRTQNVKLTGVAFQTTRFHPHP